MKITKNKIEKMILVYMVHRKVMALKAENDLMICKNSQLHEYAFNKIVEDYKIK